MSMSILLYFAFGALNIGLIYLISSIYINRIDIDVFPGRRNGDKVEMVTSLIAYFLGGPFVTIALIVLWISLYTTWIKYYKKK